MRGLNGPNPYPLCMNHILALSRRAAILCFTDILVFKFNTLFIT